MLNIEKVKSRREELGLSMDEAAKRAGLNSRSQWHYIESGNRADIQLSTLNKLATALDCDPCDLLIKPGTERRGKKPKG